MRKIFSVLFALIILFSFSVCGGNKENPNNDKEDIVDKENNSDEQASNKEDAILKASDEKVNELDAVNITEENKRIVQLYSQEALANAGKTAYGASRLYYVAEFVNGVYENSDTASMYYYFYDHQEDYEAGLQKYIENSKDLATERLRENNRASYFFAVYAPIGFKDYNNDGKWQYEEGIEEHNTSEDYYLLIE